MDKEDFLLALRTKVATFNTAVSTQNGDWIVKGFIDIARNIYTISMDTKVISKIMELLLFPELVRFGRENNLKVVLVGQQNFYPDISFIDDDGHRFALDIKTTYRVSETHVNGMTLGAFTGYFRERQSTKNTAFPYGSYGGHFILGVIYSKTEAEIEELRKYRLDEIENINSVVNSFEFFVQEKYRIALDRPGSGNTRNIGSVVETTNLMRGTGPFSSLGESIFDDYWMFYLTEDMARAAELPKRPYTNLKSYLIYKGMAR